MRSQPAERIPMSFKLEKTRVGALRRLSDGLEFKPTMTMLIEEGIDMLVAKYAKRAASAAAKREKG